MPYQRLARHVLEEWRLVEQQRLALIQADSVEAALLRVQVVVLRDEYQHLIDEATAHDRPVPPPFPETDLDAAKG
jgi:hypothetical protein